MSEAVRGISKNVAEGMGREGSSYIAKSYMDIICPPKESDKKADDIINGIKQKLREYE